MNNMVLVSAGDAITAKLVEQAGFDGIWISGFEASARLGLSDNGSITMTEMLNIARPIVRATKLPVYVDVDTGYANFSRTVKEFEAIGVAGVCIEDAHPQFKTNSLWGQKIPLMDRIEFGKKINISHKLKIIARTEALIRGYGPIEARLRLYHYRDCGADILLPHTRDEFLLFKFVLPDAAPCAIVPTKFPQLTNTELFNMGYSMVIWANQTERVKIKAVRDALELMKAHDNAAWVGNRLSATLDEMKGLTPDA